jgi:hypothetical protein
MLTIILPSENKTLAPHPLNLLDNASQGEFMLPGDKMNLIRLGLGDIPRVYPHDTPSLVVYVQHDTVRLLPGFMEDQHQDIYYKIHSGIVVIQKDNPKFLRFFEFFLLFSGPVYGMLFPYRHIKSPV